MSEFSHLKNKLLAEQVEDQIYHYILDEALEPGAKLPNEFALGEKFRVGRSTIREAVKLLSSKGIVEVRQGSGTYVVTTVKGLSDPLNLRSVQDKNALAFDLVNVRLLLEPGIAEMAAQNATPEDIERLRRLCERVETKIHEGDAEAILIEAEMPEKAEDAAMAVRRLGFYARCGAWDTHYTEHLFDAWFRILVLDCPGCASLAPEAVVEALADCYRRTISPTQWQKHVQFFAPDGSVCG